MFFSARHAVALAAVALFGFSAPAAAAEAVTLKFATQNTENAWTTVHGIKPWIEQIEKDSNGSIKIDFYANQTLTKGNQAWQAVRKGIADMSWVTMGSYPGMNLLMEIINQPGMGFDTAMEAVDRLYAITDKVPAAAKPFSSNKVLAMFSGDPGTGVLISKTPIRTLEDLKGKKIRCAAGAYLDMLKALGASVTGVCRSGRSDEPAFDRVVPIGELDGVLPEADALIMALPATPETAGVLSRERIALLPERAYVVNVGRGSAVDQEALAEALREGRIAGASLDVMTPEPLPENDPLWSCPNLLRTTHISGNMSLGLTCRLAVEMFCADLARYAAGEALKNQVDRRIGY